MMDVSNRGDRTGFGTRRRFLTAAGAAATVGLAGCLGGGDEREVRITGSSTVFPLSEAVAEEYQQEHDGVNISVSSDGTSGGFEQFFIPGDSDINGASRPILEEEVERCRENGFEPIEIQCAGDALTAIANNEADWVDCMTMEELGQIWDPDAENELWSDVNSEWPDEPFELYGPATTSGTFDYWTEEVIGKFRQIRDDFEGTEQDDIIASGVEGSRYAHGYLPFSYYTNNQDQVKALDVDAGDGCTPPSLEGASTGEYPLSRPIFWYVNGNRLTENPALEPFIRFAIEMTGDQSIVADDIGYVPMNDEEIQANLSKIDDAVSE